MSGWKKLYSLAGWIAICEACCILITIIVLANLCGFDIFLSNVKKSKKPLKIVGYLSVLSLLSFTICLIAEIFILNELNSNYSIPKKEIYLQIIHSVRRGSWTFGQLFMYLLFIANIYYTFKNTLLQISKSMLIFLYILVTIFFMSRSATITIYAMYYYRMISKEHYSFPAAMIQVFTEFIDLILSIILVYIFVNRLFKLFVVNCKNKNYQYHHDDNYKSLSVQESTSKYTTTTDEKATDIKSRSNSKINSTQSSIIHIAAKYAILSSIAIISTQLFLVSAVNDALSWNMSHKYYYYSYNIYAALLSLDCLINSLCICLNFDFNRLWFSMCCCLCDKCCYSLCIWISKKIES